MTQTRRLSPKAVQLWSWLFPITYIFHIAEEYFVAGGYSDYLYKLRGVHLSTTRFLLAQAVGVVLLTAGILIARRLKFPEFMIVLLGTTVLVNSLSHIITSTVYFAYGPGLYSSIFLWFPLGLMSLITFFPTVQRRKYWIALAIGVGINVVISIFTLRGGKLG